MSKVSKPVFGSVSLALLAGVMSFAIWNGTGRVSAQASGGGTQVVAVKLSEWTLGFKTLALTGQEVRLDVSNDGKYPHALEIEGKIGGGDFAIATPTLKPGERSSLIVKLPAGTYDVYCPVQGHKDHGMVGTISFPKGS
ncbi:MAG TPA: hypothetical protein VHN99_12135 [Deinococcales bacterium]|nr:hypothetical protein [Deinococcales bacterium]